MIELKASIDSSNTQNAEIVGVRVHYSFTSLNEQLQKWLKRFPFSVDESVFSDLALFYLIATKNFLDHRNPKHFFRLILGMNLMQKKILRKATFSPHLRHLEIRWTSTNLIFPFVSKPVLGCLVSFNSMDRYEVFDEENIILALKKYLPQLKLVKDSSYSHTSQHKNIKTFYFEIEKKDGHSFSLAEQKTLKSLLEKKVKQSIQPLSPAIFMGLNNEETYKNIWILSQEINSIHDLPQGYITFDQQTGKEIVFRITLVYVSPFHRFSLKERFFDSNFVSERFSTVRNIGTQFIQSHIFRLHLSRDPSLLRPDGSLDFHRARQKVVSLITNAVGEFRDYNGGILVRQQLLLQRFKEEFASISDRDSELLETFFYALIPLEQQAVMDLEILSLLFNYFLEGLNEKLVKDSLYSIKIHHNKNEIFIVVKSENTTLSTLISEVIQDYSAMNITYCFVNVGNEIFFNCVFSDHQAGSENLIHDLQMTLKKYHKKTMNQQILRIGLEYAVVSLDPRVGGDDASVNILRLLFEGLTRFDLSGNVENAVAEKIEISSNLKEYTFKLRSSLWNDGSPVSAYDFEYAWKKVLSPDFKTSFAYFFYPIKNAKKAKEGKVSLDEVGIKVIDHRTLKVELRHPTQHFLQWLAHPIYSPINQRVDLKYPQWPYQTEKHYPCNGPFQIKVNQSNQGFQLIKNPLYKEIEQITLDQITLTQMTPAQAVLGFEKNEVDWIGYPFGSWDSSYSLKTNGRMASFPNSIVCWCALNTKIAPFNNCKIRQALGYAIQRLQIIEKASLPLTPAFSPLLPYYLENRVPLFPDFDDQKARQLFEEGLQELNLKREDIGPLTLVFHEKGTQSSTAICLKKQFKECLGIECELKPLGWKTAFQKMAQGDFQLGLVSWTSWVDDPFYTLNAFKFSKQEINFSKWENTEFQRFIELSNEEVNPFLRSSYLLQLEKILEQEMPILPLYYQPYQAMVQKDFQFNYRAPCGPFNVARSYFKTKEI